MLQGQQHLHNPVQLIAQQGLAPEAPERLSSPCCLPAKQLSRLLAETRLTAVLIGLSVCAA